MDKSVPIDILYSGTLIHLFILYSLISVIMCLLSFLSVVFDLSVCFIDCIAYVLKIDCRTLFGDLINRVAFWVITSYYNINKMRLLKELE